MFNYYLCILFFPFLCSFFLSPFLSSIYICSTWCWLRKKTTDWCCCVLFISLAFHHDVILAFFMLTSSDWIGVFPHSLLDTRIVEYATVDPHSMKCDASDIYWQDDREKQKEWKIRTVDVVLHKYGIWAATSMELWNKMKYENMKKRFHIWIVWKETKRHTTVTLEKRKNETKLEIEKNIWESVYITISKDIDNINMQSFYSAVSCKR